MKNIQNAMQNSIETVPIVVFGVCKFIDSASAFHYFIREWFKTFHRRSLGSSMSDYISAEFFCLALLAFLYWFYLINLNFNSRS